MVHSGNGVDCESLGLLGAGGHRATDHPLRATHKSARSMAGNNWALDAMSLPRPRLVRPTCGRKKVGTQGV